MVEIKLKNSDNSWGSIPELKGTDGNAGVTPNITFNTIAGSTASVTQSGTPENLQVNLTVPNGVSGIIPNESSLTKKSGNLGSLGGYNIPFVTANALTINQDSNDNNQVTGAVTITVSNGTSNTEWAKSVIITNPSASVSLESNWTWLGGKVPTITENSLLVLHWCNDIGVANLVNGATYAETYTGTVKASSIGFMVSRNGVNVYSIEGTVSCNIAVGDCFYFVRNGPEEMTLSSANGITFNEYNSTQWYVTSVQDGFTCEISIY